MFFRLVVRFMLLVFACNVVVVFAQTFAVEGLPNNKIQSPPFAANVLTGGTANATANYSATTANQSAVPIANPPLKFTNQTQFAVPIQLDKILFENPQNPFNGVELVYSADKGKTWYVYQRIAVSEKKFDFNAPSEGEYWFAFRLVGKNGEIKQIGKVPEARVFVDTTTPKLTTNAKQNDSGEVFVEWTAEDFSLKSGGAEVSLSYDLGINWMKLATDPQNISRNDNRETGYVKFWPKHEATSVEIRCELEDLAKNKEIFTTSLKLQAGKKEAATANVNPNTDNSGNAAENKDGITVQPPQPLVMSAYKPNENSNGNQNVASVPETFTIPAAANTATGTPNATAGNELNDLLRNLGNVPQAVSADVMPRVANQVTGTGNNATVSSSNAPSNPVQPPVLAESLASTNENNAKNQTPQVPANTSVMNLENSEPETTFPGKIVSITKAQFINEQQCVVVRWVTGDADFINSKVDLYRSPTKYGPWRPIVFDLNNSGVYFWRITPADQTPFFLRIELRTTLGAFTDFTTRAISL